MRHFILITKYKQPSRKKNEKQREKIERKRGKDQKSYIYSDSKKKHINPPSDILNGPRCGLTVKICTSLSDEKIFAVAKTHSEISVGSQASQSRLCSRRPICCIIGLRISASTWIFFKPNKNILEYKNSSVNFQSKIDRTLSSSVRPPTAF